MLTYVILRENNAHWITTINSTRPVIICHVTIWKFYNLTSSEIRKRNILRNSIFQNNTVLKLLRQFVSHNYLQCTFYKWHLPITKKYSTTLFTVRYKIRKSTNRWKITRNWCKLFMKNTVEFYVNSIQKDTFARQLTPYILRVWTLERLKHVIVHCRPCVKYIYTSMLWENVF